MAALFGGAVSLMSVAAVTAEPVRGAPASAELPQPAADLNAIYLQAERHCSESRGLARAARGPAGDSVRARAENAQNSSRT